MFGIDPISSYILVAALLTLLVAVLVWHTRGSRKTIVVWLAAGLVGILLGSVASFAIVHLADYGLVKVVRLPEDMEDEHPMEDMGGGMPGSGGTPGMGAGMSGGPRQPRPKRDLTTLVRKLELLTGDVAIALSAEQAAALCSSLADVEKAESMSDDDAKAKHEEILTLLDEDQESRLDAVSLPRTSRRGGPGGPGSGGPGSGGPGGPEQAADTNPFQQEANAKALASLRERFAAN